MQKPYFRYYETQKRVFRKKNEVAVFLYQMLETYDLIANTPKHVFDKIKGQKHSLRKKTRKSLFCNAENNVT